MHDAVTHWEFHVQMQGNIMLLGYNSYSLFERLRAFYWLFRSHCPRICYCQSLQFPSTSDPRPASPRLKSDQLRMPSVCVSKKRLGGDPWGNKQSNTTKQFQGILKVAFNPAAAKD